MRPLSTVRSRPRVCHSNSVSSTWPPTPSADPETSGNIGPEGWRRRKDQDMGNDAASAWPRIRACRSAPPGQAIRGHRRAIFSAALEQSEQLFNAARTTTAAARPLLLFYGLSQAGRAIVAAHGPRPSASGHGITAQGTGRPIPEVAIKDKGYGLFQAVAGVVRSPTLPRARRSCRSTPGCPPPSLLASKGETSLPCSSCFRLP